MDIEELKSRLETNGLGHCFDKLKLHVRNSIRLHLNATDENSMAVGRTKIGGRPDLPKDIPWVTETNIKVSREKKFFFFYSKKKETITKPLSFIAQINLSEVSPFDQDGLLPQTGILYFFYTSDQDAWGYSHKDKNRFKIIYWDGDFSELRRIDFPKDLPVYSRFNPCSVDVKSEISLPSHEHEIYNSLSDVDKDIFWEKIKGDDELINKLLGYSDNIQDEMEIDCERLYNWPGNNIVNYNAKKAAIFRSEAAKWRLLLQIDSDETSEMMWGDCGRLYFWVKKEAMLNKQFDKTWFFLQCY